ncbi:voltage-dependent T-type calcium channel subunit alpha-1H-like [Gambusia affinis]|uniref:voltage-dependent T-type calcium channel subunit alpha-1H-like n=1 Tax=Gambusia affinis TaxID=33528 RepID=UPI001CDB929D|nr:voltage-dependent T-type calcium channel subunit alpha-1H-like [Gambusia affinis]XP_043997146.1 voltage-dependent T-type calcium channel subunit alpha-1H-like [Gambusia affinis]XP_043997147.1 voltage-dependent T-type calcium channel subunit alpha-1H-like [Gambusia affinis]
MTETNDQLMTQYDATVITPLPENGEPRSSLDDSNDSAFQRFCTKFLFSHWPGYLAFLVIAVGCLVHGIYFPCIDDYLMQKIASRVMLGYFTGELIIRVKALGIQEYLTYNWHYFDIFVICIEVVDLILELCDIHLSLSYSFSPMRLLCRIEEMRKLVTMLLGLLPMLGNVILLYVLVIYIFAIVGVQLWAGDLLNRCFLPDEMLAMYSNLTPSYHSVPGERAPFICSLDDGMRYCKDIPPYREGNLTCTLPAPHLDPLASTRNGSECVNWNAYYNICRSSGENPNLNSINFDNIGYSWIAVFQSVTLEGWSDIMYYVMDAKSWWSFVYFIVLTILASYVIMNTCAVVIASHYSDAMKHDPGRKFPGTVSFREVWDRIKTKASNLFSKVSILWGSKHHHLDESSPVGRCWLPIRRKLETVVTGNFFNRFITVAILLNILTMAIEHHNQPELMTMALQMSNYVFTAVFAVEMVLKLMALGSDYFTDWSNNFDCLIVIISLWELQADTDSRLSVLRAFRALRFGRLVHFLPYLYRQLMVLKRTIEEAAMLCWLLFFIVFLFSVVGMHIFGCVIKGDAGDYGSRNFDKIDSRKNFDNLLWAMVTVFQVLTLEDWNFVLYNCMASVSPWSAIFFVGMIIVGKNVILNILVGIVVENFQNQPEDHATLSGIPSTVTRHSNGDTAESTSVQVQQLQVEEARAVPTDQQAVGWKHWFKEHEDWSFYMFSPQNRWRLFCDKVVSHRYFNSGIQFIIMLNCITIAFERPTIPPESDERYYLDKANDVFSAIFLVEMLLKMMAQGLIIGETTYCRSAWNNLDAFLVVMSIIDFAILMGTEEEGSRPLAILKILRLLRTLRPLRMIERSPQLRLAVVALLASVKPMGNIILICGIFFFFYGILGVQLFKGKFFYCHGSNVSMIVNKTDCLSSNYEWLLKEYNFDNLISALISVFVMYSKDGWVELMYDGLDAVGVDQQPIPNHNLWMLLYFISFILMSFILLDMFIGVMVETFHKCQREQRIAHKSKARPPSVCEDETFFLQYSTTRRRIHSLCTSPALEYSITTCIFISMIVMGAEHFQQATYVTDLLDWVFYTLTLLLVLEIILKFIAFGVVRYLKDGWNILDIFIVLVSIVSIIVAQVKHTETFPINMGIFRVVRVLRLAQVLKTTKIKVLLKTIIRTLSQVGNISILFMFFFFIYAALGVELFGTLACSLDFPCLGLHRLSDFNNFMLALLTLYKVSTGDNWSGILKDTMPDCKIDDETCDPYLIWASPIFFTSFVITVQFVLVNLVVAVIMQALDDSRKEGDGETQMKMSVLLNEPSIPNHLLQEHSK